MIGRDYILELVESAGKALATMMTGRASDEAHPDEKDPERNFEAEFGAGCRFLPEFRPAPLAERVAPRGNGAP